MCDYTFEVASLSQVNVKIEQHKRSKHDGIIFSCETCDFKTEYASNLTSHCEYVHSKIIFQCKAFDYGGPSKRYLTKHTNNLHSEKTLQCSNCDFSCSSSQQLRRHNSKEHDKVGYISGTQKMESKEETLKLLKSCIDDSCKLRILNCCTNQLHMGVNCKQCGTIFETIRNLKFHLSKAHRRFQCKQSGCKMQDSEACTLLGHINKHKCNQCDKEYSTTDGLNVHKSKMHCEKVKFSCEYCDLETMSVDLIRGHMKMRHDVGSAKVSKCDFCDYKCLRRRELADHVRSKHDETPIFCKSCNRKYFDRKSFKDHVKNIHKF